MISTSARFLCSLRIPAFVLVMVLLGSARQTALAVEPAETSWNADWIGIAGADKPNTWLCFRKEIDLKEKPASALMDLVSPQGTAAVVGIPAAELTGGKRVLINGKLADPFETDVRFARFHIQPGTWEFLVSP